MYQWLKDLPLYWGKVAAVIGFAGMIIWAWLRPKSFILQQSPDKRWWRDLRIWATVLLLIQIIIYLSF
jgi:hypothetical protein